MFKGSFQFTIDAKGRVSIPSRFREILAERYEEKLVVTNDLDNCLVAFPFEEWSLIEQKIRELPSSEPHVKAFMRFIYSRATECELDRQGRVLIPPSLREYAQLKRDVVIVGMGNKIEIWDPSLWDKALAPDQFPAISETLARLGL